MPVSAPHHRQSARRRAGRGDGGQDPQPGEGVFARIGSKDTSGDELRDTKAVNPLPFKIVLTATCSGN